jgi:hypothetical protein
MSITSMFDFSGNKKFLYLSLLITLVAGGLLLKPHKSYAYFADGTAVPASAKQAVFASCASGNYVAQTTWISRSNDTTDTTAVIDGSYNVYLQYNMAVVRCADGQSTDIFYTQFHIIDGSFSYLGVTYNDDIPALRGVDVRVDSPFPVGQAYSIESIPFVVSIPTFVSSTDVYITARSQQYNLFGNLTQGCITSDNSDVDPQGDVRNCPITSPTAPITILKNTGNCNGNCGGGNIDVQGRVYDTATGASVPGVFIEGCADSTTTDGNGNAFFKVKQDGPFCFRPTIPAGYIGFVVKPYNEGYHGCPANTECSIVPDAGYEFQQAGGFTGNGYDRASDIGYDIGLIPKPIPVDTPPTVDVTYDCNAPYRVTITVNDADYNVNGGDPVLNYNLTNPGYANPSGSVRQRSYSYDRPGQSIAQDMTINSASSTGVNVVPPGGDGLATSNRNAASLNGAPASLPMTIRKCGENYEVKGIPQPPVLDDYEYPTSADNQTSIGFVTKPSTAPFIKDLPQRRVVFSCPLDYQTVSNNCIPELPTFYINQDFNGLDIPVSNVPYDLGILNYSDPSVPNLEKKVGTVICNKIYIQKAKGIVDFAGNIVYWDPVPDPTGEEHFAQCSKVLNHPYPRFYGNEISAGSGFDNTAAGTSCTGGPTDIKTYDKKVPAGWVGGGSQLGAIAGGSISGLASMSLIDAMGGAGIQNARHFANAPPLTSGNFGSLTCAYDYPTPTIPAGPPSTSIPSANGALRLAPSSIISFDNGVGMNNNIVMYVTGDVRINGNIIYNLNGKTQATLPSFTLVATGNIYIDPAVERLDGTYIAKPNPLIPNTGQIFTCDNNGFGVSIDPAWYVPAFSSPATPIPYPPWVAAAVNTPVGKCAEHTLTVNGAFIAKNVNFLRSKGSLKAGTVGEKYGASANPGGTSGEIFRYTPEMFIANSQIAPFDSSVKYDSILSLPPSL